MMMNNEFDKYLNDADKQNALVELGKLGKAWRRFQTASETYMTESKRQKTQGSDDSPDMAEIEQEYQEAFDASNQARINFIHLLAASGLKGVQQTVMYLAYETDTPPTFDVIAVRSGLKNADAAVQVYNEAFNTLALYLKHSKKFKKRKY